MSIKKTVTKAVKSIAKRVTRKKVSVQEEPVFGSVEATTEVPTVRGQDGQVYRNIDNARSM